MAPWFRFCTIEGNSDNAMATKRIQGGVWNSPCVGKFVQHQWF